ncbi:phage baseplate assembly protein V [Bilophila wadsworthia]|uniref:phage baseplate assembly protein V n=1 Tax=Bilophila wadsworthia TaxID=35833 RepID=UPI002431D5B7|nr:phage baseplate assembly protein V [Bilophila wadsworthia]
MNRTLEESGATFAVGIVSAVNAATGWARVRLPAYDNLETAELPVLQRRTHKDKALNLPDVGEQVALILDRRGEDGVVLGAIWSEADPVPQSDGPDVDVRHYEDGTLLRYDRKAHKLTAEVKGSVDIVADSVVRAESKTRLELAAPETDIQTNALSMSGYSGGKARTAGTTRATLRGTFYVVDGDVIADGVSTKRHPHEGVEPGSGRSGEPVPTE